MVGMWDVLEMKRELGGMQFANACSPWTLHAIISFGGSCATFSISEDGSAVVQYT